MDKVFYQGDQEDLLSECHNEMTRLLETDKVTKQAASEVFPDISKYKPDDDHFMLHAVALGGYPRYLPNRNGDAWVSDDLENRHDTFVKYGHFFREHRNRDPKQAIGVVKASAYNKALDRVELILWGNKEKAEEEYELAKQGKELSFSMSANMPYDQCSCCDNKARKLSEHCDHLKNNLNQYMPGFRKYAFAFNPTPKFFDMSRVNRPADRIAHYLEYVFPDQPELAKAASSVSDLVIPGAAWAEFEGVSLPEDQEEQTSRYAKEISKLASIEKWMDHCDANGFPSTPEGKYVELVVKNAFAQEPKEGLPTALEELNPGVLFNKMASEGVVMPFPMFVSYVTGKTVEDLENDEDFIKAARELPTMFSKLEKSSCCGMLPGIDELVSQFIPGLTTQNCVRKPDEVDQIMETMKSKFSCNMEPANSRTTVIIIKGASVSSRSEQPDPEAPLDKLASAYAAYQLASTLDRTEDDPFLHGVIGRNRYSS